MGTVLSVADTFDLSPLPLYTDLRDAARAARSCLRCPLGATRQNVVFGEGDDHAPLMVVGEAPGRLEDETGRPFVGQSGRLLTELLEQAGVQREQVYITSVLKSRPPNNRDPLPAEVAACRPWLDLQLELVAPKVVLTVGNFPTQALLGTKQGVTALRGSAHQSGGFVVVPTFHPAAVMRSRVRLRPLAEEDIRLAASLAGLA